MQYLVYGVRSQAIWNTAVVIYELSFKVRQLFIFTLASVICGMNNVLVYFNLCHSFGNKGLASPFSLP